MMTIKLPVPVNMTRKHTMPSMRVNGEFRPDTLDREARTMEVVFTTGQGGKRYDWYNDVEYIEELDVTAESVRSARLDKGLSVIDNHMTYQGIDGVFGITEAYRFEGGELIGTVRFASDEDSDKKFQKAADGILRHVSLGYKVHKYLKSRGEQDKLDTYRAIDWEPTELSFTPVSFETENGTRSAERKKEPTVEVEIVEETTMNAAQRARLALLQCMQSRSNEEQIELDGLLAMQLRADAVTPAVTPAVVAAVAPVVAVAAAPVVVDANAIRSQERGALASFIDVAKKANVDIEGATRAYGEGQTIDQYRTTIIDNMGEQSNENVLKVPVLTEDERSDHNANIRTDVETALLIRGGAKIEHTATSREYSGIMLLDVARQFLGDMEDGGRALRGLSNQAVAKRAFNSTSDFPLILENVMNKNLLGGYAEMPQTFLGLGEKTELNDFREKHMYRLGDSPDLKPLGEGGEYKSGTMTESKESYRLNTFARKILFTRQALVNDDMNALSKVPTMFGRAGSKLESDIVWGLLLNYDFINGAAGSVVMADGKALFHADHKNLLTGAGSALSKDALSDLRKKGRKQTNMDGEPLNMVFNTLVMPSDLETTAEELLFNNYIANVSGETSSFKNKFEVRIEERLAVIATIGLTAWYAFSNFIETFEYATLAGEPDMVTEVVQSMDADGMTVKVRKDFGAGIVDWRGMALSKGQ